MNNYSKIIEQIHHEFNTAGENLLQESLAIIEKAEKVDLEKANRLNDAGFANNPVLKKAKEIENETRTPSEMASLVLGYRSQFPLNKFISKADVDKICKKYNLINGSTEQYIGFVPEKNLQEIELFKKNHQLLKKFRVTNIKISALFAGAINKMLNPKCRAVLMFLQKNNYCITAESYAAIDSIIRSVARSVGGDAWFELKNLECIETSIFQICAPKKDMIKDSVFESMFPKFKMDVERHIPDPVVLYPVKEGYIIVTAWGDEASDPMVTNERNN